MEDLGTGGREGKGRLNDDVSSRYTLACVWCVVCVPGVMCDVWYVMCSVCCVTYMCALCVHMNACLCGVCVVPRCPYRLWSCMEAHVFFQMGLHFLPPIQSCTVCSLTSLSLFPSRGDQKSSHHHKNTSSSSPNHSSTSPHSTSSPYVHPPPPSQPPPPPPPSQSRHVTGKSRPQQQQQQMTLQGDPPLMGRGFPQEKSWDSSQAVGRKEEGVASAKTTKLLGSDIHHQVTSRVFPPPPLPPSSSSSSHPLVGSHDDRQRRSSSPDQDSWHTSSDTYLPSRVGGDDQMERESSLTQSYSPQMPHHRHDNQLHASNSDTKLMVSAPSSSSPSSSTSSPSFLSRPRGGAGEGSMGAEPPKGAETTRVVMNSKAEGRATHRGGRNDYILTRIVNRSDGSGGSPSHQKAGQQLLLSSNQSSPQAQSNLALQSGPQSNQPLQSSQPAQPLPPQPHVNRAEEVPQQADREAPVDQGRTQTKVTTSSPQAVSLSPEAQRDTNPPPPSSTTSSTSASSTMHDTSPVSSSTEELSKFHEEADEDSTTTTTTNILIRPTASVPSNHVHQRGAQPLPPQPPPQTYSHHQHHVRPTYGPQVGGSGGGRGLDGFPLPAPTTTTTTSLPQTRPVPSQQQYEKVFFGTELQPLYHRPPGGVSAKVPHDYQPPVDDHYLMSLSSEPFGSPQGGQGPPMLPAGGGGHKSQSRLVRVDPAQMMGSKTKVTIAHDAAVKGDVATLVRLWERGGGGVCVQHIAPFPPIRGENKQSCTLYQRMYMYRI